MAHFTDIEIEESPKCECGKAVKDYGDDCPECLAEMEEGRRDNEIEERWIIRQQVPAGRL